MARLTWASLQRQAGGRHRLEQRKAGRQRAARASHTPIARVGGRGWISVALPTVGSALDGELRAGIAQGAPPVPGQRLCTTLPLSLLPHGLHICYLLSLLFLHY